MSSEDPLEFEEWDGASPFWHHCVAGSIAGVAEHTLVYPFDTVKTHLQACTDCPHTSTSGGSSLSSATNAHQKLAPPARSTCMWTTMRHIVSQAAPTAEATAELATTDAGMGRLWRGVNTLMVGCIPAHALYFSMYEAVKHSLLQENGQLSATGGMAAGAAAAVSHDVIMTPLDTVKQRLQLGHYRGMADAFSSITKYEGYSGLFRSFPITLLTNIPYGMIMVSTNEVLKQQWVEDGEPLDLKTCILASSVAGMAAAALTTPLDRLKTFLQTQQLQPACQQGSCPKLTGPPLELSKALTLILQKEGPLGLFRGMVPRVITHTPAVAISWTTYETCKQWLANHYLY
jgi:solute carrier family 25 iron transporter 28/37